MSLRRAIGAWLTAGISGLYCYADQAANAQYRYPACVVTPIGMASTPIGSGGTHYLTRDGTTNNVAKTGRLHLVEEIHRLTFMCVSTTSRHGQDQADAMADAVALLIQNAKRTVSVTMTDAVTSPSVAYIIDRVDLAGRQEVPSLTTQEPFVYRAAISIRTWRRVTSETAVDGVIEQIALTLEGEPQ